MLLKNIIRKFYYSKFGSVGIDSLIPLRSGKNINNKKYVFVGDYCSIGPDCCISANAQGKVVIKNGSIIAPNVTILTRSHNYNMDISKIPYDEKYITGDVIIESGVWIGQNVIILPGVHIGKGAVIGAGAVVSKSIPACAVCVGNPAKIIKYRDKDKFYELDENNLYVNRFKGKKSYVNIKEKSYLKENES